MRRFLPRSRFYCKVTHYSSSTATRSPFSNRRRQGRKAEVDMLTGGKVGKWALRVVGGADPYRGKTKVQICLLRWEKAGVRVGAKGDPNVFFRRPSVNNITLVFFCRGRRPRRPVRFAVCRRSMKTIDFDMVFAARLNGVGRRYRELSSEVQPKELKIPRKAVRLCGGFLRRYSQGRAKMP